MEPADRVLLQKHSSLVLEAESSNPPSFQSTGSEKLGSTLKIVSVGSSPHGRASPHGKSSPNFERQASSGSTGTLSEIDEIHAAYLGAPGSIVHRIVFLGNKGQKILSPLNDLPIHGPDGLLVCICKTPAGHWLKYEAAVDEPYNPLRPVGKESSLKKDLESINDRSEGPWNKVRSIVAKSILPSHYPDNAPWNVGFLPQTFFSPTESKGLPLETSDGSIEVIDIGAEKLRKTGDLYCIKLLGGFTIEGKSGGKLWKMVGISHDDPMAPLIHEVSDVASYLPGLLDLVADWLKSCINFTGVSEGSVVVQGPYALPSALSIIADTHRTWFRFKEASHVEPPSNLKKIHQFSPIELEVAWKQYAINERTSFSRDREPLPLSCPTSESNMLFQEAWIEPEEEDKVGDVPGTFAVVGSTVEERKEKKGSLSSSDGTSSAELVSPVTVLREKRTAPQGKSGLLVTTGGKTTSGGGKVVIKKAPSLNVSGGGAVLLGLSPDRPSSKGGNMSPRSDISAKSTSSVGDGVAGKSQDAVRKSRIFLGGFGGGQSGGSTPKTDKIGMGTVGRGLFGIQRPKVEEKKQEEKVVTLGMKAIRKMSHH